MTVDLGTSQSGPGESVASMLRRWWRLILAAALLGAVVGVYLGSAEVQAGNEHILVLELSGDGDLARRMGLANVPAALAWDLLLIAFYTLLLSWVVPRAGRWFRIKFMRTVVTPLVTLMVYATAATDLVENLFLYLGATSGPSTGSGTGLGDWIDAGDWVWPAAAMFAWAKWLLILVLLGFLVGALVSLATTPKPLRASLQEDLPPATEDAMDVSSKDYALGIALSGGGIRSSSICLGALQALERPDADLGGRSMGWGAARKVTAISGGSNMAAGWSIARSARPEAEPAPDAWSWREDDVATTEEQRLIDNLGYLLSPTPRGGDATGEAKHRPTPSWRPSAYATILTGFVINAAVLFGVLWLVSMFAGWAYGWLACQGRSCPDEAGREAAFRKWVSQDWLVAVSLVWLGIGIVCILLWVLVSKVSSKRAVLGGLRGLGYGGLVIGTVLVIGFIALPRLMLYFADLERGDASLAALAGSLGSLGAVVRVLRKPAVKYAPVIGGLAFGLLIVFLGAYWAMAGARDHNSLADVRLDHWAHPGGYWVLALLLLVALYVVGSPESWSLAGFYRGRLRLAYATRRQDGQAVPYWNGTGIRADRGYEPDLHRFAARGTGGPGSAAWDAATPLTVCTTATISTRDVRTHYGIPALSVTFTPSEVTMFVPEDGQGRWGMWRCSAEAMNARCNRKGRSRLTTMLAVAISSAALSPAMGRFRIGPTRLLLTFANVRLGVWMPNPRHVGPLTSEVKPFPRIRLGYLFKELFGIHDPSDLFLYLTDGGHWENTGLVELLRSGNYQEILCVDADPGPGDAVKSVSQAIDLARLECAADVHLNLDALREEPPTSRAPGYADRSVNLGFFERGETVGLVWYAKPALTEDMPSGLLAHRETHPDFPRISTMNQFFDVSTFHAYRELGRHNAIQIKLARERLRADIRDARAAYQQMPTAYRSEFDAFLSLPDKGWAGHELAGLLVKDVTSLSRRAETYDLLALTIVGPETA